MAIHASLFPFSPRTNRAREIAWREWGDRPFDEARRSDKPILLSIVTFWSTSSYAMDEGAFSDQRVIDLLGEQFVAVRVDADERPDVAERYGDDFAKRVTDAFLNLDPNNPDHAEILSFFGADGFISTENSNYDQIEAVGREIGQIVDN